jgi:uncharacterized membrane protein YeaQ/YmgE (transglycosylase-associated protein family)
MNILLWIIFGALVGWVASLVMSTSEEQGMAATIVIGVAGALLGGAVARAFGFGDVEGFDVTSLLLAVSGAVVIIAALKAFQRPHDLQ